MQSRKILQVKERTMELIQKKKDPAHPAPPCPIYWLPAPLFGCSTPVRRLASGHNYVHLVEILFPLSQAALEVWIPLI